MLKKMLKIKVKIWIFIFNYKSIHLGFQNMFYFFCELYFTRAIAIWNRPTILHIFTNFSASFLTTSVKILKKSLKNYFIQKSFIYHSMTWSKVPLCKKWAKSGILANDLCQPSVHQHLVKRSDSRGQGSTPTLVPPRQ